MVLPVAALAEQSFAKSEHHDLVPGLQHIHRLASRVGTLDPHALAYELLEISAWVDSVLEPHVAWEEADLYLEIDRRAGTPWATRLMRFEHRQIRAFIKQLEMDRDLLHQQVTHDELAEIRGRLYGFEALLRAHLEREELYLIPLLGQ
jgi:hemerythrin-like domain-containing protein